MVIELTSKDFKDFVTKNKIVVVDFWAEWCGPCKVMSPVFEEVSKELTRLKFAKVDVDSEAEIANSFSVMSIPTIIIFHEGKEVTRISGFVPKAALKAKLNAIS